MFEDHPDGLTKRKLRKQMLEHNVPLTRLDTHLLFKALEHPTTGLVTKGDFTMFIEDPGHYKISKSKKGAGVHTGWIVEEVEEEEGFGLSKMDNQYMELITDLYEHIKEDQVDVAGELRKLDTNHDGIITFDNFKKFNKNIHSPLTTLEQKSLFDKLKEILGGNVTIPDLTSKLTNPPEAPKSQSRSTIKSPQKNITPADISKLEKQINDLESNVQEKNKTIIAMEKEISYFKDLASANKAPSVSYSTEISTLEQENRNLNRKLRESEDRYQRDKNKLEELIKENINTPQSGDFLLLQKKIEYLERNVYERENESKKDAFRSTYNAKDKQEIKRLQGQIEAERAHYAQVIEKKNREIAIFRDELDMMLHELEELKTQNLEKEQMFMSHKSNLIS